MDKNQESFPLEKILAASMLAKYLLHLYINRGQLGDPVLLNSIWDTLPAGLDQTLTVSWIGLMNTEQKFEKEHCTYFLDFNCY